MIELDPAAVSLWVRAGSYCARHDTTGYVPAGVVRILGYQPEAARELVKSGMWREVEGGFRFHEWRKHQDGDYRPNIPLRVRRAVMDRDDYRCVICGSGENLSLDHIIRYRDDGPDTIDNLRVLCMPCNNRRG